jgi:hypothetical protein
MLPTISTHGFCFHLWSSNCEQTWWRITAVCQPCKLRWKTAARGTWLTYIRKDLLYTKLRLPSTLQLFILIIQMQQVYQNVESTIERKRVTNILRVRIASLVLYKRCYSEIIKFFFNLFEIFRGFWLRKNYNWFLIAKTFEESTAVLWHSFCCLKCICYYLGMFLLITKLNLLINTSQVQFWSEESKTALLDWGH